MNKQASVLTLRIPFELKHKIELQAEKQGVSVNQLAMYLFTKDMVELDTHNYLRNYWKNKSKKQIFYDVRSVMAKVGNKSPKAWDKKS
jgi:hypothetical protein